MFKSFTPVALVLAAISPLHAQLKYEKWSGDLNIPDPVAISLDNQGCAYVTQTQRRKLNDLDIRDNTDWIPNDVGMASVAEKMAFYHKVLAPEFSEKNKKRVADLNKDGSHDWKDLTVVSEKIHRVEDTNGDGKADKVSLFAEGFNTEVTGVAAGVLWHDGNIYATIAPDLWKIPVAHPEKREAIAHGFGLHIAYGGHDMHGLTMGPDGRIYWTIGDKGVHVTSKEGKVFDYPNQGCVLRCEPDGSHFEVFAHGLRNMQEIAFDDYGNLFGVDNDADKPGEKERFVHIVQHSDAGWRNNYQFKEGFNPWTSERLWEPRHSGQPAYIIPPLQSYLNGPAGFVYNPGTALSEKYKGFFICSQFPSGQQNGFRVEADGASFKMIDDQVIGKGQALIGMNFGPDGALYAVDWAGGYPLNQKGAIWKIDVPKNEAHPLRAETKSFLEADFAKASDQQLAKLLGHADQRVRMKAQFELVKRDKKDLLLAKIYDYKISRLARLHAVWGYGQLTRYQKNTLGALIPLAGDENEAIRVAYAQELGQNQGGVVETSALIRLLADESPMVRFQAALALGNLPKTEAVAEIQDMIIANKGTDLYLRHAGIQALAATLKAEELGALANHVEREIRLSAILALRKKAAPEVASFLADPDPELATEAARAIHDDKSIMEALPALADSLMITKVTNESFLRRAINANYRLGKEENAQQLARYAARPEADSKMRADALWCLANWAMPSVLDHVDGRKRDLGKRDEKIAAQALSAVLPELLKGDAKIKDEALKAAGKLHLTLDNDELFATLKNEKASVVDRITALAMLEIQKAPQLAEALRCAFESGNRKLAFVALPILAKSDVEKATILAALWIKGNDLQQTQIALAVLTQYPSKNAATALEPLIYSKKSTHSLILDLESAIIANAKYLPAQFMDSYKTELAKNRASEVATIAYAGSLEGGDLSTGRRIAMSNIAAQCTLCHAFGEGGSTVGPNLGHVGEKGAAYILESLVQPNAKVAAGYGMGAVTLKNGDILSGSYLDGKDADDSFSLKLGDGTVQKIAKADIKEIAPAASSMPPIGSILTRKEIRDLVTYLSSLK